MKAFACHFFLTLVYIHMFLSYLVFFPVSFSFILSMSKAFSFLHPLSFLIQESRTWNTTMTGCFSSQSVKKKRKRRREREKKEISIHIGMLVLHVLDSIKDIRTV